MKFAESSGAGATLAKEDFLNNFILLTDLSVLIVNILYGKYFKYSSLEKKENFSKILISIFFQ